MIRGRMVLITGASGAGKDAVIGYARCKLTQQDVIYPRRIVTRLPDATEISDTMDGEAFVRAEANGLFLVSWRAHDLSYALPSSVLEDLAMGRQIVANVSRNVIASLHVRFECCVVSIEAPEASRRQRLGNRQRESAASIESRLRREVVSPIRPNLRIENDGPLADAGEQLVALLRDWRRG